MIADEKLTSAIHALVEVTRENTTQQRAANAESKMQGATLLKAAAAMERNAQASQEVSSQLESVLPQIHTRLSAIEQQMAKAVGSEVTLGHLRDITGVHKLVEPDEIKDEKSGAIGKARWITKLRVGQILAFAALVSAVIVATVSSIALWQLIHRVTDAK